MAPVRIFWILSESEQDATEEDLTAEEPTYTSSMCIPMFHEMIDPRRPGEVFKACIAKHRLVQSVLLPWTGKFG